MKLIEALKNLTTIQKRMAKNNEDLTKYCSYVSTEVLPYETEEKQRGEVARLLQANHDLQAEYIRLKIAIEHTNLGTRVKFTSGEYSIAELITIRRTTGALHRATYKALNIAPALTRLQATMRTGVEATNPPKVIPLYSQPEADKVLRDWDEFLDTIDARLEVVNAETELTNY